MTEASEPCHPSPSSSKGPADVRGGLSAWTGAWWSNTGWVSGTSSPVEAPVDDGFTVSGPRPTVAAMSSEVGSAAPRRAPSVDRVRLDALRYAVNEEASQYIAIMRLFTSGLSGMLSDQSAGQISAALTEQGFDLGEDVVEARLSYLVEHGNLARSPRESEARTVAEYLRNRARYQLSQRGELVHRQVEELLGYSETAREVSTEMLGGMLTGLVQLGRYDEQGLTSADPDILAREIGTLFAQFDRLVHSTREFYAYLTQVLSRYDLDRREFQVFKSALLDYLQRFVDEVQRHMPEIAEALAAVEPRVVELCARANSGQRLLDLEGRRAQRDPGLDPADWQSLRTWFTGDHGRSSDADGVRRLATEAMRALLANLRRIAASSERERGSYADLIRLAGWFDEASDDVAHALWASATGLYSCRHLGAAADDEERPVAPTTSWWDAPPAEVPIMLRRSGQRRVSGRTASTSDFSNAKASRLAERERVERERAEALAELSVLDGDLERVRLSDQARDELLNLYAACLAQSSASLAQEPGVPGEPAADLPIMGSRLVVRSTPGRATVISSPSGRITLVDRTLSVQRSTATNRTVSREVS